MIAEKLIRLQSQLKAPKNQMNSFGGYKYRSCEDILEAVKPLLAGENLFLTLSDDIVSIGQHAFVKATATISDGKEQITTSACARDSIERKGMDASQITGAASSYARKYALNGLFCIDDTKDADATNTHDATTGITGDVLAAFQSAKDTKQLKEVWVQLNPEQQAKYRKDLDLRLGEL